MGGCQTNIPCTQEIKSKMRTQTLINDISNKDIVMKDGKNSLVEDKGISNEDIKINIPMRSYSSTKILSRNLKNNKFSEESLNNIIKPVKRKSFNLTTANKTPTTQQNNNNSNDNFILNSKKINKIEINNFGINNLNDNIISSRKIERAKNEKNQIMLNSLISNKPNDKNNINKIDNNKIILRNIDNNAEYDTKNNNNNIIYENLQIEDIISEEKIHTKNNNEVVFRGNLLLINDNGERKNEELFCVMSRINLKLYKNISFFLKMKKPLLIINMRSLKNIHIIKDNIQGLCFSLLDKYIFTSKNKDQLFKWIVVLNYFSNKLKE